MEEMISLILRDGYFDETYSFNLGEQHSHDLEIKLNDSVLGKGYIKLLVKFVKNPKGFIYCRIYQVYATGKQQLNYDWVITNLLNPRQKVISVFVQGYENNLNTTSFTTDDIGNTNGQYQFNSISIKNFSVDVSFVNPKKQEEMDNLYKRRKQQEEYYKLHMVEIDTIRALSAAYDQRYGGKVDSEGEYEEQGIVRQIDSRLDLLPDIILSLDYSWH